MGKIELTKQNNKITNKDENLENEQLISKIHALTNRNEIIEEQLLKANNTITILQGVSKKDSENITIHAIDKTIPEITVNIKTDD